MYQSLPLLSSINTHLVPKLYTSSHFVCISILFYLVFKKNSAKKIQKKRRELPNIVTWISPSGCRATDLRSYASQTQQLLTTCCTWEVLVAISEVAFIAARRAQPLPRRHGARGSGGRPPHGRVCSRLRSRGDARALVFVRTMARLQRSVLGVRAARDGRERHGYSADGDELPCAVEHSAERFS